MAVTQVDSEAASGELHMLVQIPLPNSWESIHGTNLALWPANRPFHDITYRVQLETARRNFKGDDVICRKTTHAFRALSARNLREAGAAERVSWFMACITVPAEKLGMALARALQSCACELAQQQMLGDSSKVRVTVAPAPRLQRAASHQPAGLVADSCAC